MSLRRFVAEALGTPVAAIVLSLASAGLRAQAPTPATLFHESSINARGIPATDTTRTELLRRIARAQIWVGEIDSALVTSQSLGPWRREVQTDATCRLLEDHRFDDADRLVRRYPIEDRDWALAHLASRLGRPPWSSRLKTPVPIDTAALRDRALAVAREIRSPEARVDAFIALGNSWEYRRDTTRVPVALAGALAALPEIRDRDLASSRLAAIIDDLGDAGYTDSALTLLPSLLPRDRISAAWGMGRWRDARGPHVRAELLGLVPRVDSVANPRVRRHMADGIVYAFNTLGDSATADSVAVRLRSDPTVGRQPRQRADVLPSIVERAERIASTNVREAIAIVDTLDDPFSYGRRARAFVRVVSAASNVNIDTIALLMRRARESALAQRLSPRQLSLTLIEIAEVQLGHALVDDGAVTLNAIPDRAIALSAFRYLGGLQLGLLPKSNGQRLLASLRDADLRAAAATRVIGPWLEDKNLSQADFDWVMSVVDSLPRGRWAESAQVLIARTAFFRGDTAAARDRSLSVLRARDRDWSRWQTYPFGDELIFWVVRGGGLGEALAWARALPSPASRAAGLLEIGDALDAVADIGKAMRINNRLNACRDEF